ncbi:MAG: helix-turn-helix domain-containing protein [Acutalibacteraceae bacterium]
MEKKTIGGFIAALRKSAGMTQRDLADKLNVSDKAVSRWERDECAPDLSLIPVIADIFGVTADELLRGERKSAVNATAATGERGDFSAKSKKQIQYLLRQSLTNYRIQSMVAAAIALVGIIAAAIANAFNHAFLGLGIGCIIYVTAAVCLAIFTVLTLSRTNSEDFEAEDINDCKKSVAYTAWTAGSVIFIIFCTTLPLSIPDDVYLGLRPESWFVMALACAVPGIIISALARYFITSSLMKRGIISITANVVHNRRLTFKMFLIFAAVIAATFIAQSAFNAIAQSEMLFVKGTTFDNYYDFKKYMEMPIPASTDDWVAVKVISTSDYDVSDIEEYYSEEVITDDSGRVLCRYIERNENVCQIIYSATEDYLPITVYNYIDCKQQRQIMDIINIAFVFVYLIEAAVLFVIYRKKRVK